MGQIRILSTQIANKIAAGEVIERPVSVVKELLENAIDAGADTIEIRLLGGGLRLIQVTDNGCGMVKEDLPLAFERHATSKIKDFNDLFALHSFGFRGEALASIATVSQVNITSGVDKKETAWQYTPAAEQEERFEPSSPRQGTQLEVRNLFYNVPARRKFVKSEAYEFGLVAELFSVYATAYPTITLMLWHNDQLIYTTVGRDSVEDRFVYFRSSDLSGHLLHLQPTELAPGIQAEAWMSDATVTRKNRKEMTIFVNGRWVKNRDINTLIENAYHTYIPSGRFPSALLKLSVPADVLDVNIHPAKTTVKIAHPGLWQTQLEDAIRDVIWQDHVALAFTPAAMASDEKSGAGETGEEADESLQDLLSAETDISSLGGHTFPMPQRLSFTAPNEAIMPAPADDEKPRQVADQAYPYQLESNLQETVLGAAEAAKDQSATRGFLSSSLDAALDDPLSVGELASLQVIGQLNNTFILAQNKNALYIIDQHTCHERILYDSLMQIERTQDVSAQRLLHPFQLSLTPAQKETANRAILVLRDMGIIIEIDEDDHYNIIALPTTLVQVPNIQGFILDILALFEDKPRLTLAELREDLLTTRACKSAVKANWPLSHAEQHALIQSLSKLSTPKTCPHGRPIFIEISMNELYRFFKRGSFTAKP